MLYKNIPTMIPYLYDESLEGDFVKRLRGMGISSHYLFHDDILNEMRIEYWQMKKKCHKRSYILKKCEWRAKMFLRKYERNDASQDII